VERRRSVVDAMKITAKKEVVTSGGKFNYNQYRITEIADEIENIIKNNGVKHIDDYGDSCKTEYPDDIIAEFKKGVWFLRMAEIYAQRIDWLVSHDDGEDSFRARLVEDVKEFAGREK